jgi:hypothetical protein
MGNIFLTWLIATIRFLITADPTAELPPSTLAGTDGRVGNISVYCLDCYHDLAKALNQTQVDRQDIYCFRTRQIAVQTDPPQRVAIDGDVRSMTPIEIQGVPNGLTVYVPR